MTLLIYGTTEREAVQVRNEFKDLIRGIRTESVGTFNRLVRRLRKPSEPVQIAVFMVADREDFDRLLTIRDYLCDVRSILILPWADNETISQAHSLRPRFVSHQAQGLHDVEAVLGKMLARPD